MGGDAGALVAIHAAHARGAGHVAGIAHAVVAGQLVDAAHVRRAGELARGALVDVHTAAERARLSHATAPEAGAAVLRVALQVRARGAAQDLLASADTAPREAELFGAAHVAGDGEIDLAIAVIVLA